MFTPKRMVVVHALLTLIWLVMVPVAIMTGWVESLVFISAISIYANFAGHFSSWQASRTEVAQQKTDEEISKKDEEIHKHIEEIYEKIVKDPRTGG